MKISIVDLMGHYYDDPVKIKTPQSSAVDRHNEVATAIPKAKTSRAKRPLLVAAALLLAVTAAVAAPFTLSRTVEKEPLNEGVVPVESVSEELPSTLPTQFPDTVQSSMETAPDAAQVPTDTRTIAGALEETSYYCHGNILYVDGRYYTLTEDGPEPLETVNLQTTVELYGTWTVDIDYAVVDGTLVFHNNTSTARYTFVDGKQIKESEYLEQYGEWPEEVYEPDVAVALPVEGSADTVMLQIDRRDQPVVVDGCDYKFFLNVLTGEISDPLANVPELFNHGPMRSVQFNSACTRAILTTYAMEGSPVSGSLYPGNTMVYVCDLMTGEITDMGELLSPYVPELEDPEVRVQLRAGSVWADDDTILCWMICSDTREEAPNGGLYVSMYSYDLAAGELNYRRSVAGTHDSGDDFNQAWLYEDLEHDNGTYTKQMVDTACGATYDMETIAKGLWTRDSTAARSLLEADDGTLYLVDTDQMAWAELTGQLSLPDETFQSIQLLTDDWLCLGTAEQVHCYRIPNDLSMTLMTTK